MQAVITGDVINSQRSNPEIWLPTLKTTFSDEPGKNWQIYRGDEFQLYIPNADEAFLKAIRIKANIKKNINLDVRISIGLGQVDFLSENISESSGTAFINSGRKLEKLKQEKINLGIQSENADFDENINLIFNWLSLVADNWSVHSAEIMEMFLHNPHQNQEKAAEFLGITQSSVSQRLKRANYDLIMQTNAYFRKKINQLK